MGISINTLLIISTKKQKKVFLSIDSDSGNTKIPRSWMVGQVGYKHLFLKITSKGI